MIGRSRQKLGWPKAIVGRMANYECVLRLIPAAVSASIPAIVAMPAIVEIAGAAVARRRRRALSAWPVGNTKPAARIRRSTRS